MVLVTLDQVAMLDFQIWIMRQFWSTLFWIWNLKFVLGTTQLGTARRYYLHRGRIWPNYWNWTQKSVLIAAIIKQVICSLFFLSIFFLEKLCHTGTSFLTRVFGPDKNRVKGKPRYRRGILVLKPPNGEFKHWKSTFSLFSLYWGKIAITVILSALSQKGSVGM